MGKKLQQNGILTSIQNSSLQLLTKLPKRKVCFGYMAFISETGTYRFNIEMDNITNVQSKL
jgi:hypothetical protein